MAERPVAVTHISPLSAFKVALAMSLIGLVAWLIAVTILYIGMEVAGIWDAANSLFADVGGTQAVGFGLVISIAALMGAIVAVLMAVLAPLAAVVYNGIASLFGGMLLHVEIEEP
ncbi:hypothetical protein C3B44_00060 [Corynebacterium yudongzhengii]|uniref:DUF3566 domain-containing protein n=1 Tax=Corynebacterium yudongzhengii TaxID=2080740 RepID=A0A2U1T566_9CORY|nr:DUF3566 domain-containing protein [Corynebacterium yudongzhengii]AWB80941.1 hypothetical protein C3B44_00060 [Corynebacterium yudongzhengii]PWC01133.1 DUF3566 domain-containing protein [Corynebacterium yudongzhengii]